MRKKPVQLTLPLPVANKSNGLCRARLKSGSTLGFRIAVLIASMIKKTDEEFKTYTVDPNILTPYNLSKKDMERMKDDLTGVVSTTILIQENTVFTAYPVFQMASYDTKTKKMTVGFNDRLKDHLLQLEGFNADGSKKGHFTQIPTGEYMHLTSEYTQKLYVFLLSWNDQSETSLMIDDLHEMLNSPELYRKDFYDFKRKILIPAHKQITGKTCLDYEWEAVTYKRKTTAVRFVFSEKKKTQLRSASYHFKKFSKAKQEKLHSKYLESFKDTPTAIRKEWTWLENRDSKNYINGFKIFLQKELR